MLERFRKQFPTFLSSKVVSDILRLAVRQYLLVLAFGIFSVVALLFALQIFKEEQNLHRMIFEESLVDISNILAIELSSQVKNGKLDTDKIEQLFTNLKKVDSRAKIYASNLDRILIDAYVTDERGIVVYDSQSKTNVGKDFSKWRDVRLTLEGKHGARSTPKDPDDPRSPVYYVSAPIIYKNSIIGVVSVSKSFNFFVWSKYGELQGMSFKLGNIGILAASLYILTICVLFLGAYRAYKMAIVYADRVAKGEKVRPPKTLKKLGVAMDEMRIALEGRKTIENYIQSLTHALKTPLSAIKASAELLQDSVPKDKVGLFSHIDVAADRATQLIDDLLELARLENLSPIKGEKLYLDKLIRETCHSLDPLIQKKKINLKKRFDTRASTIKGEEKLVLRIFDCIIKNAIEFSPSEGKICIETVKDDKAVHIFIRDQGPGVPDYARGEIFNKFYSLERPSGQKSSGMGLALAQEVIALHNGVIQLEPVSKESSGATFKISFPAN